MNRTSFALAALLAASLPAHAQVYKCVDGERTVYSQIPCPANSKSSTISRSAPAGAAPGTDAQKSAAPPTAVEREQEFRKRQQDQAEAAKKEGQKVAESKERQENCANARRQLAQYEAGGRIVRTDENGERSFLGDDQIASEQAKAQERVNLWCK